MFSLLTQAVKKDIRQILFSVGTSVRWGVLHSFYEFRRENIVISVLQKGTAFVKCTVSLQACTYVCIYLHLYIWIQVSDI